MEKDLTNTNLKCLITLPSSAILFSGYDALFFQSTLPLSILGIFHFFQFPSFLFFFLFFLRSEGKNYLACVSKRVFWPKRSTFTSVGLISENNFMGVRLKILTIRIINVKSEATSKKIQVVPSWSVSANNSSY